MNTSPDDKARRVRGMFDSLAPTYDLLNTLMTFRRHKAWRRFAVKRMRLPEGGCALDVCAGTGDFAIELARAVGPKGFVAGVDFSLPMLALGQKKVAGRRCPVEMILGDALRLSFPDNTFDGVAVGWGLRNVSDIPQAVSEMSRVVRPGGCVASLDLSRPTRFPFKHLYHLLYFSKIVPLMGQMIHGNRDHYAYLPESLQTFPTETEQSQIMASAGLRDIQILPLTFGVVSVVMGWKE
ncbi:MAG: bifunctional demethylmenaquinone methyltransferase/2-methoxy-6-polyprenyl-1,4-benzoquinol methylase UbiE [Armatimonadetes bacterium]|nr:bifunctional demethylmenaquinone methyltransferase/2-methoxy-6-polyprenyl-1,4-benzoquinol methylase UbiE [Armatimonadota bacterium]